MGITWKEVHNQNNAALIQTLLNSGQAIGDGIAGIGKVAGDFATEQTESETAKLLADISGVESGAARQVMIDAASAQSDFLDFEKIRTVNWELGSAERAEDLALFEDRIADENRDQEFKFDQILEKEAQSNRFTLANYEHKLDLSVAKQSFEYTQAALDANFTREKEEAETKHAAALETFAAEAANEQALKALALTAENDLKEALALLEDEHALAKQKLENIYKENKDYYSQLAAQPSGLKGIYTNAAGGLDPIHANTGHTNTDSAAYNSARARIFTELGIDSRNIEEIERFDRWAAQNIQFISSKKLNEFIMYDLGGKKVKFGKLGQTWDSDIKRIAETYNTAKVAIDIKDDLYRFYASPDATILGGNASKRDFDIQYQTLIQEIYKAKGQWTFGDDDPSNDIDFNAANARKIFVDFLDSKIPK